MIRGQTKIYDDGPATMRVYLAGPFFNKEQHDAIGRIETVLEDLKINHYSPRSEGKILVEMPLHERAKHAKEIFDRNVEMMEWGNAIVAVIDGRDAGTMVELGYCIRMRRIMDYRIITYTDKRYGLNVMLQEAVDAHVRGHLELAVLMQQLKRGNDRIVESFRSFQPEEMT